MKYIYLFLLVGVSINCFAGDGLPSKLIGRWELSPQDCKKRNTELGVRISDNRLDFYETSGEVLNYEESEHGEFTINIVLYEETERYERVQRYKLTDGILKVYYNGLKLTNSLIKCPKKHNKN